MAACSWTHHVGSLCSLGKQPLSYLGLAVKNLLLAPVMLCQKLLIFLASCMHLRDWFLKGMLEFLLKLFFFFFFLSN